MWGSRITLRDLTVLPAANVPEPSPLPVMTLGLAALAWLARRRAILTVAALSLVATVTATGRAGAVVIDLTNYYEPCQGQHQCGFGDTVISGRSLLTDRYGGLSTTVPGAVWVFIFANTQSLVTDLQLTNLLNGVTAMVCGYRTHNDTDICGTATPDDLGGLTLTGDLVGSATATPGYYGWDLPFPFGNTRTHYLLFQATGPRNYDFSVARIETADPVPEPSSLLLMASGLILLGLMRVQLSCTHGPSAKLET